MQIHFQNANRKFEPATQEKSRTPSVGKQDQSRTRSVGTQIANRQFLFLLRLNIQVKGAAAELKVPLPRLPEAVLKTERPPYPFRRLHKVSEKSEVVTLGYESITVNTLVAVVKKVGQYFAVAPELSMDIPHIIILVTVEAVIVVVAALVRAEFLIRPAQELSSAVKTYSFHSK